MSKYFFGNLAKKIQKYMLVTPFEVGKSHNFTSNALGKTLIFSKKKILTKNPMKITAKTAQNNNKMEVCDGFKKQKRNERKRFCRQNYWILFV